MPDVKKFWKFKNTAKDEAELQLYGSISEYSWWGDDVTPKQFSDDLKALGDVTKITVRINSGGGDVFAAHAIYSQLKDHPAEIVVKIDGLAASSATIVAMAGDKILIPTNGTMMIHDPMVGLLGYYNASELKELEDYLNGPIKKGIIEAYKTKTGKDDDDLSDLMSKETWMVGKEAIDEGFADEILFKDVSNILDNNLFIVNSISHDLSRYKTRPEIKNCSTARPETAGSDKQGKGDEPMEIKNTEDLQKAYPKLVKEIQDTAREEGRKEERTRIQDIEKISNNIDPALVKKAKFEEPVDAKELAFQSLQMDSRKSAQYLNDAKDDSEKSGSGNVKSSPQDTGSKTQQEIDEEAAGIAAAANRRRGIK